MGQYYHAVILSGNKKTVAKWFLAHAYGKAQHSFEGLKLMEHSWFKNRFVGAVESVLVGNPQRIVWAGDYADDDKGVKTNVYSRCTDNKEVSPSDVPPQVVRKKYIVNHTKKEFINKSKIAPDADGYRIHPLPLMTCEGNGQGGGDFFGEDTNGLIGSWARDVISVEGKAPKGFKEIVFDLKER